MEPGVQDVRDERHREGEPRLVVVWFAVYLLLLAWTILWKLELPFVGPGALRSIKLTPYLPSGAAGASTPSEVVANVVLFVPFGLYLGLLAPRWPWWKAAAVFAGASLLLETMQYVFAVGSSDITDVIDNVAGGLVGIAVLALARRTLGARTAKVVRRICIVGTAVAVLLAAVFVVSPLRFGPSRDPQSPSRTSHH
jgi:glycopeptide antibiotics resistance protein